MDEKVLLKIMDDGEFTRHLVGHAIIKEGK
jgi:hypothetical protein